MRTHATWSASRPALTLGADAYSHHRNRKSHRCQIDFTSSTLPRQFRGAFLLGLEHDILRQWGEAQPYPTKLFIATASGPTEVNHGSLQLVEDSVVSVLASGPHARTLCASLARLADTVLATTEFDQDGFVITR